jgi:TPR repeat protein
VELDLVHAHKYFNLAAMKGVVEARLWRSELAQQMSTNDIAEAQRLARLWLQETAH